MYAHCIARAASPEPRHFLVSPHGLLLPCLRLPPPALPSPSPRRVTSSLRAPPARSATESARLAIRKASAGSTRARRRCWPLSPAILVAELEPRADEQVAAVAHGVALVDAAEPAVKAGLARLEREEGDDQINHQHARPRRAAPQAAVGHRFGFRCVRAELLACARPHTTRKKAMDPSSAGRSSRSCAMKSQ